MSNNNRSYTKEPHGKIELEWEESTLTIKAHGPFNIEGIKDAIEKMQHAVKEKKFQSWLRIEIGDENAFGDPEVMEEIKQSYLWGFENGCTATAFVYCNSIQKLLCEKLMANNSINFQCFDCIEKAKNWLEEY